MTSRDTHDIEEYEREQKTTNREQKTTNVQPALMVKLMMESEPCLFANKSQPAVIPYRMPHNLMVIRDKMLDISRWHAQLQISFERCLLRESLNLTVASA